MIKVRPLVSPGLVLLAASVVACESPLSPGESFALERAEAQWATRSFQDYAIEVRGACFCPEPVTQWARVEVVAGGVDRVVLLAVGEEVPAAQRTYFRTVEQMFTSIRTVANEDWVKDVVVEFDRDLGFPTYVSFVPKPDILDAGAAYYWRNAGPIP